MSQRRGSISSRVSQRDDVRNLPYFHSNFNSTDEVAHFIKKKAKKASYGPGCFLLRPSNRNRDLLTASVLVGDNSVRHTHIQIEQNNDGYCKFFLVVEKKFDAIQDLVDYYKTHPVKNLENVDDVFFNFPLCHVSTVQNQYTPTSTPTGTPEFPRNDVGGRRMLPNRSTSMSSLSSNVSMSSIDRLTGIGPPPPLPVRPRTRSINNDSGASGGTLNNGDSNSFSEHNDTLANRPALPLPIPRSNSNGEENPYYSRARDVTEDISQKLKDVLKSTERCECGIPRVLAELPMGWTVHLSKDQQTYGRLFYQNEEGVTSWTLPERVRMQLTNVHIQNLKQIDTQWTLRQNQRRNTTVDT